MTISKCRLCCSSLICHITFSSDQTELLESNLLTATLLSVYEVYSPASHTLTWTLAEQDFKALAKQGVKVNRSNKGVKEQFKQGVKVSRSNKGSR